ncbi:hypothetical protein [Aneurinibacillus aneurinilyticus]|uniref:hypothetical protein n=1 Tax=Aneurinibacillus aneurinilyticus TaxID=1391 RepID=UPI003525EC73
MNSLLSESEAKSLFPQLQIDDLGAALVRASIFVRAACTRSLPVPTPDEVKLAVCLLVQVERPQMIVREIARSDYKESFDTKDPRWNMIESLLRKYGFTEDPMKPKGVQFL